MAVGALLVVVAVGVFTAVTWSALGPGGQALVLIGATLGAGAATVVLADRGLRATAEAVGVVTAALALATFEGARDLLLTEADPWLAWAFGCAVVASSLAGLGFVARVRAPVIVALFLGQLCVPLVLAGTTPPVLVVALAALGLAVADAGLAVAIADRRPEVAALAAAFGGLAWSTSVLVGAALLFDAPGQAALALLLAAGAATALAVSSHPAVQAWRALGAASGTVAAVLSLIGATLALGAGDAFWFPVGLLVGGFAIWFPSGSDDRLVAMRAVAAGSAALAVSAELARSLAAAAGPFVVDTVVRLGWSATGRDLIGPADGTGLFSEADPTLTFLALIAATGLLVRWPYAALAVGSLAIAASGVLLDLSVVALVVVEVTLGVGLCLASALDRRLHAAAGIVGLILLALATGWSTVVALELVLGSLLAMLAAALAAVVLAVDGRRVPADRRAAVLLVGVGSAWLTALGVAVSFGMVMAWAPVTVWLFAASAAMVGSVAGFALTGRFGAAAALSDVCAVMGIWLAGLVAVQLGDAGTVSLVLAGVTATATVHTLRSDRFWPAVVTAMVSGVSLLWLRLWMADVVLVEAYSLPLAVGVGLLGWIVHRRGHGGGSWAVAGPALLVAIVPSTLMALQAPGELRSLVVIAAAVVMIVVGATLGWKAPLVLGAAVATVVGLAELWPAINRLPRWSVLAALGLTLIVLGARIEEGKKGVARLAGRLERDVVIPAGSGVVFAGVGAGPAEGSRERRGIRFTGRAESPGPGRLVAFRARLRRRAVRMRAMVKNSTNWTPAMALQRNAGWVASVPAVMACTVATSHSTKLEKWT